MSSIAQTAPQTTVSDLTGSHYVDESVYATLHAAVDRAAGDEAITPNQKQALAWLEARRDPTAVELQVERHYLAYQERRLVNASPLEAGKIQALLSNARQRIESLLAQVLR